MGVINVTPDSFSDGGRYLAAEAAIAHGRALASAGADILDVGGESTRPGAATVSTAEQIERVVPVLRGLAGLRLSIDTTDADVARAALQAGATIVNDISGGRFDARIWQVANESGSEYVCGHLRGNSLAEVYRREEPVTVEDVERELRERLDTMPASLRTRTWIDPGLGFGKGSDPAVNFALLHEAGAMGRRLGRPVLVGPSRKRFLRASLAATATAQPTEAELDAASARACLSAISGGVQIVRIHNVAMLRPMLSAFLNAREARVQ